MLTYGRNKEIELYQESDLKYLEYVIDNKIVGALWSISFTLPKYILISPNKTIDLIAKILKIRENSRENEHLIHSIFDNKDILEKHSELIKEFVFNETLEIPLDSYYFENALSFLDNTFGFDTLFNYLQKKVAFLEVQKDYFSLSLHKHYDNPTKDSIQKEKDFLIVIKWYADLTEKSEYLHKKLVEYLRPTAIQSDEFKTGFKLLIDKAGKNIERVVDICNALDVDENKSELLISMLIEISNELCQKYEISNENLVQIFGLNFIYNLSVKSGTAGGAFPQDLAKRDYLIHLIEKYQMHPKVMELFIYSLDKIKKDIERDELREFDEKW